MSLDVEKLMEGIIDFVRRAGQPLAKRIKVLETDVSVLKDMEARIAKLEKDMEDK